MSKIGCELCMDLMALVRDDVASAESKNAVLEHLESCDVCRNLFEQGLPVSDEEQALQKTIQGIRRTGVVILALVLAAGILLCELVMQGSSLVFVLVYFLTLRLIRIVLNRRRSLLLRLGALVLSVLLAYGVLWLGNGVFGNPISKALAENHIQGYLEGRWEEADYSIEKIQYNMSAGSYDAWITSASKPEDRFEVIYRDGKILYDTYGQD